MFDKVKYSFLRLYFLQSIAIISFFVILAARLIQSATEEKNADITPNDGELLLPEACRNFTVFSGKLSNQVNTLVIGEHHNLANITAGCLFALMDLFPSFSKPGVTAYLEGPLTDDQKPLVEVATSMHYMRNIEVESWDNADAFEQTTFYAEQSTRITLLDRLKYVVLSFSKEYRNVDEFTLHVLAELINGNSALDHTYEGLPDYNRKFAKKLFEELLALHKSSKKPFFKKYFENIFNEIRKKLPSTCSAYSDNELGMCYHFDPKFGGKYKTLRDQSLLHHVKKSLRKNSSAFFVAGAAHLDPFINPNIETHADERLLVLKMRG